MLKIKECKIKFKAKNLILYLENSKISKIFKFKNIIMSIKRIRIALNRLKN